MPPRVLILSAAVGVGHIRAAEALELALKELNPDGHVKHIDVLSLTNALFRRVYGMTYLDLVNHAPHVLGYIYDVMDRPRSPRNAQDRLRVMLQKMNMSRFLTLLNSEKWDVIANTHFLSAEIIAHLRKKRLLHTPQVTITTDFDTHRMWVNQPCERYTTATEEGSVYLQSYGVPGEHIAVTGIPIHPVFCAPRSHAEMCRKHGLATDRPVVLHMSGGFGLGPIAKLYRGILETRTPLQVVAVTGRNAKVKAQLETMDVPKRHKTAIFGFTDKIDELMAVADIVVSKPGGLTTSEVLARGAVMAIINPIPGQESRNSDYLLENGAAIKINNIPTIPMKLDGLLNDPAKLKELKRNVARIARPRAAYDAARIVLDSARMCR